MTITEYRSSLNNRIEMMFTPMIPFGMLCDEILGKSTTRGWTKDGVKRPLEIRRAKREDVSVTALTSAMEGATLEKKQSKVKQKTTITEMIQFAVSE